MGHPPLHAAQRGRYAVFLTRAGAAALLLVISTAALGSYTRLFNNLDPVLGGFIGVLSIVLATIAASPTEFWRGTPIPVRAAAVVAAFVAACVLAETGSRFVAGLLGLVGFSADTAYDPGLKDIAPWAAASGFSALQHPSRVFAVTLPIAIGAAGATLVRTNRVRPIIVILLSGALGYLGSVAVAGLLRATANATYNIRLGRNLTMLASVGVPAVEYLVSLATSVRLQRRALGR